MDPGSKVTYNGVEIGRVGSISETVRDRSPVPPRAGSTATR
ncbi:MlaD family protein [Mycobacterium avium]|nr:MlaD family protein [Mycobacterium avium]